MPNYSYSQPTNPWTLSAKNKPPKSKNSKKEKKKVEDFEHNEEATFRTAHQALICNQMIAGKTGKSLTSMDVDEDRNSRTNYNNQNSISVDNRRPTSLSQASSQNLPPYQPFNPNYNTTTKRLGVTGPYRNPMRRQDDGCPQSNGYQANNSQFNNYQSTRSSSQPNSTPTSSACTNSNNATSANNGQLSEELAEIMSNDLAKNLNTYIVERILNEIIGKKDKVDWNQIGGLGRIKEELDEIVILPMKRPDLFVDLLTPCKGLLLFGPPGTGKTMIGRCIASQSDSTFFSISASSLASKWAGEPEQLVRALFAVARIKQPSVIFIDEIDSLLTQRSEGEQESSRRIKTEFLVQFDGMTTSSKDNLLVIGATNLPHALDEAARRRFTKRLYIPLPNLKARLDIIELMLRNQKNNLDDKKILKLCRMTKGYSGADLAQLCKDAALNIIRRYGKDKIMEIKDKNELPPIAFQDFLNAVQRVKATVSENDLVVYKKWNQQFGAVKCYDEDDEAGFGDEEKKDDDSNRSCVILDDSD